MAVHSDWCPEGKYKQIRLFLKQVLVQGRKALLLQWFRRLIFVIQQIILQRFYWEGYLIVKSEYISNETRFLQTISQHSFSSNVPIHSFLHLQNMLLIGNTLCMIHFVWIQMFGVDSWQGKFWIGEITTCSYAHLSYETILSSLLGTSLFQKMPRTCFGHPHLSSMEGSRFPYWLLQWCL